ncbi:hypothetical protein ALI144C_40295 [Actinosynnema sp. ALI-1.44]|nr:hypothetical protein ALI144C_40295 [Actinosynnema sp. ALI-1.44]
MALCAAVSVVGIPSTASAGVFPAAQACSTAPYTAEVPLRYQDLWTYTFKATWCAEEARIVWAEVAVTHEEHSETCTWIGRLEEWTTRDPGTGAWTVFDMSEYSCRTGAGTAPKGWTPWAMVTVQPDGISIVKGKGYE